MRRMIKRRDAFCTNQFIMIRTRIITTPLYQITHAQNISENTETTAFSTLPSYDKYTDINNRIFFVYHSFNSFVSAEMDSKRIVVVIGAGVIGLTTAITLQRELQMSK